MSFVRRLVSLCLTLAFAGYGLIASAPAHAHSHHDNTSYAVHVVALDAHHSDDHHDLDHQQSLEGSDELPGNDHIPDEHSLLHVHAVASFTTVGEPSDVPELISTAVINRAEQSVVRVSGRFVPLKKPPRTFL